MRKRLAVALVHHPVLDRAQNVIATNITNFDIHDIARACRVYDVETYYIVHPMEEQLMFVSRVLDHWRAGTGSRLNPMRKTALTMVKPIASIEAALRDWGGDGPVIATSAKEHSELPQKTFSEAREVLTQQDGFLVFGTGFGLADQALDQCDFCIEPIRGVGEEDYRHLSVRSAVSICLDRLRGP
ncbi:MAG: RNA methyltransferase [Bdellovibrionales bacterium]|nr:RNA methyltransferase [Bdellovibrionales bacterium]